VTNVERVVIHPEYWQGEGEGTRITSDIALIKSRQVRNWNIINFPKSLKCLV
jgi:hypothetical protein